MQRRTIKTSFSIVFRMFLAKILADAGIPRKFFTLDLDVLSLIASKYTRCISLLNNNFWTRARQLFFLNTRSHSGIANVICQNISLVRRLGTWIEHEKYRQKNVKVIFIYVEISTSNIYTPCSVLLYFCRKLKFKRQGFDKLGRFRWNSNKWAIL